MNPLKALILRPFTAPGDKEFRTVITSGIYPVQKRYEPFNTNSKSYPRVVGTAELFYQPVIASAARYRILSPEPLGLDLKGCPGIVIQAAHEPVIERKRYIQVFKVSLQSVKMNLTFVTDIVKDGWRAGNHIPASFYLAVKDPQGIDGCPPSEVRRQRIRPSRQIVSEILPESGPAGLTSAGIKIQGKVRHPQRQKQL